MVNVLSPHSADWKEWQSIFTTGIKTLSWPSFEVRVVVNSAQETAVIALHWHATGSAPSLVGAPTTPRTIHTTTKSLRKPFSSSFLQSASKTNWWNAAGGTQRSRLSWKRKLLGILKWNGKNEIIYEVEEMSEKRE